MVDYLVVQLMRLEAHMQTMIYGHRSISGLKAAIRPVLGSVVVLSSIGLGTAQAATLDNPFPAAENLTQDEITQISAAFEQALADGKPGTVVVWKSSESGRAGQVRVLRGWDAKDGRCVEVEQRFNKGNKAIYEVPYCQGQDGAWKITF